VAKVPAFLDDYAALGLAFLDLFEATFGSEHLEWAERLAKQMIELFWDPADGGFFYTAADHERLIARTKPATDGSVAVGNSLAALLWPAPPCRYRGERVSREGRAGVAAAFARGSRRIPSPTRIFLPRSTSTHASRRGRVGRARRRGGRARFARAARAALPPESDHVLLRPGRAAAARTAVCAREALVDSHPTAYVCHRYTCSPPVTKLGRAAHDGSRVDVSYRW